jgi:hypothetical protein
MKKLMYEQQRGSTTVLETENQITSNANMKKLMYEQQRRSTTVLETEKPNHLQCQHEAIFIQTAFPGTS